MAYEKTWSFGSINCGVPSEAYKIQQILLLNIKNILLSSGKWTIYGCCGLNNGGTLTAPSALPDTTDRWKVYTDITAPTSNSLNTPLGWCILYNSTLNLYFALGMTYLYNGGYTALFFTQTAPTLSATTTWYPTLVSNKIGWSGFNLQSYYNNAVRYITHYAYTSDGHFIVWNTGDLLANSQLNFIGLLPIAPSRSVDATPWVFIWTSSTTINTDVFSSGSSMCFVPLLSPNTPTNSIFLYPGIWNSSLNILDLLYDDIDGNINMFPILICGTTTNAKTLKGRLQDIYWAPYHLPNGSAMPSTGQIEYMKIGPLMIPANSNIIR